MPKLAMPERELVSAIDAAMIRPADAIRRNRPASWVTIQRRNDWPACNDDDATATEYASTIGAAITIQPAKWLRLMNGPNGLPPCSGTQKPYTSGEVSG